MTSIFQKVVVFLAFLFISFFFCKPIFLINADLGRHIKNGEITVKQGVIPSANYYSYTEPDFKLVNHHWGSGVIYYFIHTTGGFKWLSLVNILAMLGAIFFFFYPTVKQMGFVYAFLGLVLSIPLLTYRVEVRPEIFSFLFMGVFYYLFHQYSYKQIALKKLLMIAIPLQLVWVNMHIFFVFGWGIAGAFILNKWLIEKKILKNDLLALAALFLVCFLNPYTWQGIIEPFFIFKEYGYMVVENQSIPFMHNRFPNQFIFYHVDVIALCIVIGIAILLGQKKAGLINKNGALLLLTLGTFILSYKIIRSIPIAGLFAIPALAFILKNLVIGEWLKKQEKMVVISAMLVFLMLGKGIKDCYTPFEYPFSIGLPKKINKSAQFIKSVGIQGPIFNNYDIGGFFIYHLFPQHRVFVDNRPEAYSVSFFKEIYEPMQEFEEKWLEMEKKYGFSCIYFYRLDQTPF